MATLIKEKQYVIFTNDKGNVYKFDISTGTMLSTKGQPMKSTPTGFITTMEKSVKYTDESTPFVLKALRRFHECENMSYSHMQSCAKVLLICDKLTSIGFCSRSGRYNSDYDVRILKYVDEHLKEFAKAYKDNNELTLHEFVQQHKRQLFFENELKIKCDMYYTQEILNIVYNLHRNGYLNIEQLRLSAYYLSRGLMEYEHKDTYRIGNRLTDFFEYAETIGYTPTKDDFFKQYIMVQGTYKANKTKYDNQSIIKHLSKHNDIWEFENDDFCIVVPQTTDDFKYEADCQSNCVYRTYMPYVVRGETNVVFIRKKSEPNKPHITCEVSNNGTITQFLLAHNCSVYEDRNPEEYKFLKEFREFLAQNWHK